MSSIENAYIHGRCAKTNLIKHWPKTWYFVKDGKVYNLQGSTEAIGIEDNSVLTEESVKVLEQMASRHGENATFVHRADEQAMDQDEKPLQSESIEETTVHAEAAREQPAQSSNPEQTTSTTKENTMNDSTAKTAATATATEAASSNTNPTQPKPMSAWGLAWRFIILLSLLIAAIMAICFGVNFGIAYIAAMELGTVATTVLSTLLYSVGAVAVWFAGDISSKKMVSWSTARATTLFSKNLQEAELSAA